MSDPIDELIARGYTGIAVEHSESYEEKGGYQDEHETTTLVARKPDGSPVRIVHEKVTKFSPNAGAPSVSTNETPLGSADYEAALVAHQIVDTPEYRDELAARTKAAALKHQAQAAAQAKLNAVRPTCPTCSTPMKTRYASKGKSYFWGCAKFPKCKGTRSMDTVARKLVEEGAS